MDIPLTIFWTVPANLSPQFDSINIYRSTTENYSLINTIPLRDPVTNEFNTSYVDNTLKLVDKDYYYYLIKFASATTEDAKFYLTTYLLTPKEQRLVANIRSFLGTYISKNLTDVDIAIGIKYAIQLFNQITPVTSFDLKTFPPALESLIVLGGSIQTALAKYLGVALTDFNYSDQGLSLTIDRGTKVTAFIDKANSFYSEVVYWAKKEFMFSGLGVGTQPLPISVGGRFGNFTAIFDLFNAVGR